MGVYVGRLFNCRPYRYISKGTGWKYSQACHLLADPDSLDDLHKMAYKIGLKRHWFQDHSTPHYDLVKSKRILAIKAGATEIDFKAEAAIIRAWRERRNAL